MGGPQERDSHWGLSLFSVHSRTEFPVGTAYRCPAPGSRVKVTFSRNQSQEHRHEETDQ